MGRRNTAEYGAEHQTDWTDEKPAGERLRDLTRECRNEYMALGDACHLSWQIRDSNKRLDQLKRDSAEWRAERQSISDCTEQFAERCQELGLTEPNGKIPDPTSEHTMSWLYDDHDAATHRYANAKFYEGLFERTGLDLVGNDEMPAYGSPEARFPNAGRYPQLHELLTDAARDNRGLEFEWRKADRLNRIADQLANPRPRLRNELSQWLAETGQTDADPARQMAEYRSQFGHENYQTGDRLEYRALKADEAYNRCREAQYMQDELRDLRDTLRDLKQLPDNERTRAAAERLEAKESFLLEEYLACADFRYGYQPDPYSDAEKAMLEARKQELYQEVRTNRLHCEAYAEHGVDLSGDAASYAHNPEHNLRDPARYPATNQLLDEATAEYQQNCDHPSAGRRFLNLIGKLFHDPPDERTHYEINQYLERGGASPYDWRHSVWAIRTA